MINNQPAFRLIQRRRSCRHYSDQVVSNQVFEQITEFVSHLRTPLSNEPLNLMIIGGKAADKAVLKFMYGVIHGNPNALLPSVKNVEPETLIDLGYVMEKVVLYLTSLKLETCWLSIKHNPKHIENQNGFYTPAIVVFGQDYDDINVDVLDQDMFNSSARLELKDFCFHRNYGEAFLEQELGEAEKKLFNAVRLAPSGMNKQPWRIVKNGDVYHFYQRQEEIKILGIEPDEVTGPDLQKVDMGVAMCHFELMMNEMGSSGRWLKDNHQKDIDAKTLYIISYQAQYE